MPMPIAPNTRSACAMTAAACRVESEGAARRQYAANAMAMRRDRNFQHCREHTLPLEATEACAQQPEKRQLHSAAPPSPFPTRAHGDREP